jgi:hypothetical protein
MAQYDTTLIAVPANAPGPVSLDRFKYEAQSTANSRIEEVQWSPDSLHALILIRYADLGDPVSSFTFKLMVYDLRAATLTNLGDGLHPAWNTADNRVQWFRLTAPTPGQPPQEALYSANPDGTDLRSVALPAGIEFIPHRLNKRPSLPWSDSGNRIAGCIVNDDAGDRSSCGEVAVYDLAERRLSPPLRVALQSYRDVKWIGDSALLWQPADATSRTLYVQAIQGGATVPLPLKLDARLSLVNAIAFSDGQSVLAAVQNGAGTVSYVVVDVTTGAVTSVKNAAPLNAGQAHYAR